MGGGRVGNGVGREKGGGFSFINLEAVLGIRDQGHQK